MAQWNKNKQDYLNQERSLFEVYMCADRYGNIDGCHGTSTSNSAFGENVSVPITPVFQLDGLYGLNSNKFETYTSGTPIAVFNLTSGAPDHFDLDNLRLVLPPQTKFSVAVSSGAVIQTASCGVTFVED